MIEAASAEVAYAISAIFLINIAAVLAFPVLGHALGMSQQSFGLFAGTAVNDTSSVVATATTYGTTATSHAIVVKLVRTLMIIPICLGLATLTGRKQRRPVIATAPAAAARDGAAGNLASPAALASARMSPRRAIKLVPWFLISFVLVAAVNSCGIIPAGAHFPLEHASVFLVSVALSAIGLSTNVAALRKAGARPLILGAVLWITVATAQPGPPGPHRHPVNLRGPLRRRRPANRPYFTSSTNAFSVPIWPRAADASLVTAFPQLSPCRGSSALRR